MKISVTNTFLKATKKLHKNQKSEVQDAIEVIEKNPEIGERKKGDLLGIQVYKFFIQKQLMLLAYQYIEIADDEKSREIENELVLLSLSSHQNFYRDLKK